jgi:hypothetical protein
VSGTLGCGKTTDQPEGEKMKMKIVLMLLALFLASCSGSLKQSEFLEHDTMYKNWDHMKFSWFGYRNPTDEDRQKSMEQGWWGFEVPDVSR